MQSMFHRWTILQGGKTKKKDKKNSQKTKIIHKTFFYLDMQTKKSEDSDVF